MQMSLLSIGEQRGGVALEGVTSCQCSFMKKVRFFLSRQRCVQSSGNTGLLLLLWRLTPSGLRAARSPHFHCLEVFTHAFFPLLS